MPTATLIATDVDGRAQTPRFIQRQLRNLDDALRQHAHALQMAAIADNAASAEEALLEFSYASAAVRRRFVQIDVRAMLDDEYRAAAGRDWCDRRSPAGIVYIRPQHHTYLYSVVVALSCAIAAGNCVMVEIQNSLLETPRVLQQALSSSLDPDTFAVVDSMPNDETFAKRCLLVDQTTDARSSGIRKVLRTCSEKARVVAIVDRSADVVAAAKAVVQARIAFKGRSPYAPDVVLVNEFVMDEFVRAAVNVLSQQLSGSHKIAEYDSSNFNARKKLKEHILSTDERSDSETTVVIEGDNGILVKIGNRNLPVLSRKIAGPNVIIQAISSLDDAIDCANLRDEKLLATYHFAASPAAKYTSQFIDSFVSFVNHIPEELQVGPVAPSDWPTSVIDRYRSEMFSMPSPIFVGPCKSSERVNTGTSRSQSRLLTDLGPVSLPVDDQREGKVVGFFDQGLITGVSILLTPVIGVLALASFYGLRPGFRRLRA